MCVCMGGGACMRACVPGSPIRPTFSQFNFSDFNLTQPGVVLG